MTGLQWSVKHIKNNMVYHHKSNTLSSLHILVHAINAHYWVCMQRLPGNQAISRSSRNKSKQKSDSPIWLQGCKWLFAVQASRAATSKQKEPTPWPYVELRKDGKTEHLRNVNAVLTTNSASSVALLDTSLRTVGNPPWPPPKPKQPKLIKKSPTFHFRLKERLKQSSRLHMTWHCIELPHVKQSFSTHPQFQIPTHSYSPLHEAGPIPSPAGFFPHLCQPN